MFSVCLSSRYCRRCFCCLPLCTPCFTERFVSCCIIITNDVVLQFICTMRIYYTAHVIFAILIFCEMFLKVSIEPLGNFQSIMRTVREYLYVAMIYAFVPKRSKLMVATRGKFSVMVVCALVFFVFVLEIRKLVRNSNSNSWWSYVRLAPLCVSSFLLCRKVVVL